MNQDTPAYGLWMLAIINPAIFIMFAFRFFKPQTARDWRTFGELAAFVVVLLDLLIFPILVLMHSRLAISEEAAKRARFGAESDARAVRTPRFVPSIGHRARAA